MALSVLLPNRCPTTLSSTSLTLLKVRTCTKIDTHSSGFCSGSRNIQSSYSFFKQHISVSHITSNALSTNLLHKRWTLWGRAVNTHACLTVNVTMFICRRCGNMWTYMSWGFNIDHCIKLNPTAGGAWLLNFVRFAVALLLLNSLQVCCSLMLDFLD